LTFGFEPFEERASLLCHAERGHDDVGGHNNLLVTGMCEGRPAGRPYKSLLLYF
jgi:hypothetical protein